MTEKRFIYIEHKGADYILDSPNYDLDYIEMLGDTLESKEIVDLLNELHEENQDLKSFNKDLAENLSVCANARISKDNWIEKLSEENEQLKKELYLMHMRTMFSTVQSFKGDVSKRYKYSKERDTVYDTANHYGQYHKILDKKEIVMLLNEYETVLNELKGDME